jgi:hypothetical protein
MEIQMDVSNPQAQPLVAQPPETIAHDRHFPFDWNGWGIGVETDRIPQERRPGESIVAWRLGVRAIVDGY